MQLAKSQNVKAMEIAQAIATHLSATDAGIFSVRVVPPGWIHLELTHPILATWLQSLVTSRLQGFLRTDIVPVKNLTRFFPIQYAHARCCSLVLLAEREGLLHQRDVSGSIPWLDSEAKLRLNHPAEWHLIGELVEVVDLWELPNPHRRVDWEKAALSISQAWDNLWCQCPIWGEIKITSPELAQARIGLLMATQFVLRYLLEVKLGVVATSEL